MRRPLWIFSLALAVFWVWTMPARAESPTAYARGILDKVMSLQNTPPCPARPGRTPFTALLSAASILP
jgi:hypothetical protein